MQRLWCVFPLAALLIAACGSDDSPTGNPTGDIDANTNPADAAPDAPLPPFLDAVDLSLSTSFPPYNPAHLVTADFNRDGKPDFAILDRQFARLLVVLNTTPTGAKTPVLGQQVEVLTYGDPIRIAAADLNADSKPDLVVSSRDRVSVFMNATPTMGITPRFEDRVLVDTTDDGWAVALGDLNGDGAADLVVGSSGNNPTPGKLAILRDTTAQYATAPTFSSKVELDAGIGLNAIAIADFDDDGKQDIAVSHAGFSDPGRVSVFRNTTTNASAPTFAPRVEFAVAMAPTGLVAVDLDLDGKRDIAVSAHDSDAVSSLLNTTTAVGSIAFATHTDRNVGNWPSSIAAGVQDRAQHHGHGEHHGSLPFVAAATSGKAITVRYGVSLSRYYDIALTEYTGHVAVGDFNADGKDDVASISSPPALTITLAR